MKVIEIANVNGQERAGVWRVSAQVAGEEVWYESADVPLRATPEAFLSAFFIPAQAQGDALVCAEPVCAQWRANMERLAAITAKWWGKRPEVPLAPLHEADAARASLSKPNTHGPALFFSGGVDSFFTLLRSQPRPVALVNVAGYDIKLPFTERQAVATASYQQVAEACELPLITVRTNLREHSYFRQSNWLNAHGGALAAVAHFLRDSYPWFRISSSFQRDDAIPLGTHGELDALWAAAGMKLEHWGDDFSRIQKLKELAEEPLVRQHLRVCWEHPGTEANCGECNKCVTTRLVLSWLGKEEAFAASFLSRKPLEELADKWEYWKGFIPESTLDAVIDQPGHLSPAVYQAFAKIRHQPDRRMTPYQVHRAGQACRGREGLLPDSFFAPLMKLSQGKVVYYHRVSGNVGDDLIHAGTAQLFARFGIRVTWDPKSADQIVLCGGGNLGIWEACERERQAMYEIARKKGIALILYPQSVASESVILPDEVVHRFVRERYSQLRLKGAKLVPDMALALHVPPDAPFIEKPAFPYGVFLREDREGLFADFKESQGDPRHCVERDWREYVRLASLFEHVITDRLHFGIAALLAGRRVILLPNSYHKIRGVWEAWLQDLGCEWADHPEHALAKVKCHPATSWQRPKPRPPRPESNEGLALTAYVHNEETYLEPWLRYHYALGVERAYLFLDRCTDGTRRIAERFPWVKLIDRPTPDEPHYCRTYQVEAMDEARQWAREEGLAWLLHLDPDEFAFAENVVSADEGGEEGDLCPAQRHSPHAHLWRRASLTRLLRDVPPQILQVVLETREACPQRLEEGEPFWRQTAFLHPGDAFPHPVMDPVSRQWRPVSQWLGHTLGKPIIRTSARVQAYNAHRWTTWQGCRPPVFPQALSLPTWHRGWHAHFHDLRPKVWLKKYRAIARQHAYWPNQKPMDFPKLEWSRAAVSMDEAQARAYLEEGFFAAAPPQGAGHRNEALARLLDDVMAPVAQPLARV